MLCAFAHMETTCPIILAKLLPYIAKSPLLVDEPPSKTSLLNFPKIHLQTVGDGHSGHTRYHFAQTGAAQTLHLVRTYMERQGYLDRSDGATWSDGDRRCYWDMGDMRCGERL